MKKVFALGLALCLVFAFCACSNGSKKATYKGQDIDIDLAELSTTAAYSEATNMNNTPKDYKGKIVRVKGTVVVYEGLKGNYYAVEIADSTACCNAYIEFDLEDGASYPKEGDEITVSGVFNTYVEAMQLYTHLETAVIE